MSIYCCVLEFLRFWKFSRNRLAGDESPPGDSSVYVSFGDSRRGTAWRHIPGRQATLGVTLNFWVSDEAPGGVS